MFGAFTFGSALEAFSSFVVAVAAASAAVAAPAPAAAAAAGPASTAVAVAAVAADAVAVVAAGRVPVTVSASAGSGTEALAEVDGARFASLDVRLIPDAGGAQCRTTATRARAQRLTFLKNIMNQLFVRNTAQRVCAPRMYAYFGGMPVSHSGPRGTTTGYSTRETLCQEV